MTLQEKKPFTSEDLNKIEKKMSEIIDRDVKTKREVWPRDKAIKHFKKIGEKYKAEIIEVFLKMKSFQFIIMEIRGTIYVEGHIYPLLEKLVKLLSSQKYQVRIGEVTLIKRCCNESMEHAGAIKNN